MSAINPVDVAALAAKNKVKKSLKLFHELYEHLSDEYRAERRAGEVIGAHRFDIEAAESLKKRGNWIHSAKQFGHIPGIEIGDQFHFRAELAVIGLHCQYTSGIDYMWFKGKRLAISVVDSGRYENRAQTVDVLIYSGQGGGHAGWGLKVDQKLERGNLALVNSMDEVYPVRVIRKIKNLSAYEDEDSAYTYDGLYVVKRYWQERDDGKLVFKFELHRMPGQERLGGFKRLTQKESCVVEDVSQGKETLPIRAMNGIDGKKPPAFAYITSMIYPEWRDPIWHSGCSCIDGCSNAGQCACIFKNGGEIPFTEKGVILEPKAFVYECGPSCKCPVSCTNRVSQRGPRYKLEIYKTKSGGWRVRSRSYISARSFICEYIGKWQQTKNVVDDDDEGTSAGCLSLKSRNHDDHSKTGFTIDATKVGNVGRFIRYSRLPNLFAQRILYDHDDVRMPHIVFFAAKNIPPLRELTCDYSHEMDQDFQFRYRPAN